MRAASGWEIAVLLASDLVGCAQCMAIEAEAFPFAGVDYSRAPRSRVWVGREARVRRPPGGDAAATSSARSVGETSAVRGFLAAWPSRTQLYIHALAVDVGARREGLGRALLRAAVAHARREGLPAVALHVWTGNHGAIALYHEAGFVVDARVSGFYRAGAFDGSPDAYAMVRPLRRRVVNLRPESPARGQ